MADSQLTTKYCRRCDHTLPIAAFGRNRTTTDGLQCYCRACCRAIVKPYWRERSAQYLRASARSYAANPEPRKRSAAAWRAANPERAKVADKRKRARNPEKYAALKKRWREQNPDTVLASERKRADYKRDFARRWRQENPGYDQRIPIWKRRAKWATRRARQLGAFVEVVHRHVVYERDLGICGICGEFVEPADASLDHIVALANGGEHSYRNIQLAHLSCNLKKGARAGDRSSWLKKSLESRGDQLTECPSGDDSGGNSALIGQDHSR